MDFVSLGGLASIGAGLLLHLLSLDRSKEAKRIEKATHVERLDGELPSPSFTAPLLLLASRRRYQRCTLDAPVMMASRVVAERAPCRSASL